MRDRLSALAPLCLLAFVMTSAIGGLVAYANGASAEPTTSATSIEYAEYRNDRWKFSLFVPADTRVETHYQEPGGEWIQFTSDGAGEILTVSATPYAHYDVTLQRFGDATDNADQGDHLEIVNASTADLFKVWFTKNGVLFVVTTPADREHMLTNILPPDPTVPLDCFRSRLCHLDHADVDALLQEVRGKAVAQRVRRHSRLDLGGRGRLLDYAVELACRHRQQRVAPREQPCRGPPHPPPVAQELQEPRESMALRSFLPLPSSTRISMRLESMSETFRLATSDTRRPAPYATPSAAIQAPACPT
jgi:hypothetical protein